MSAAWLAWPLAAGLVVVGLGIALLLVEVLASVWPARGRAKGAPADGPSRRPRLAIVVPAHNESAGIVATLDAARAQLDPADRLLVVADNCSDDTAAQARGAGADVVERQDDQRRGKGYALDFGMRALAAAPPDVVVVLDADCLPAPGALARLATRAASTGRPVQGLYLMNTPAEPSLRQRVATFAWRVKNHARPLGLSRMGLPCQLMGTGMAFPWAVAAQAPWASGHLVEDMQLGAELAGKGVAPLFEPEALVTSEFPEHDAAARSQRMRWEHGHLQLLLGVGPSLLWRGVAGRQAGVAALALDLMIPPLSLLFLVTVGLAVVAAATGVWIGSGALSGAAVMVVLALAAAIGLAWRRFGRDLLSAGDLSRAPLYALAKLPIYIRYLAGRQVEWVRTRRRSE
jgi:cellulose synthase/poly-beta-1,6-N-acetylglucosamine synthase-like glycosyltransferase